MRKSWDEYFLNIAVDVSERATCERLKVGAVIVKENRIIACGYNGGISGEEHCINVGCKMDNGHCIRTIHAEHNAILQCAKHGIPTNEATIYVTHLPCYDCMQAIIQSGINTIIYLNEYRLSEKIIDLVLLSNVRVYQYIECENKRINKRLEWTNTRGKDNE